MCVKVLMGLPKIPCFSFTVEAPKLEENYPALGLCCDTAHCPWRCVVFACVCVPVYVHLHVLGIKSVGCVPAGDSLEDDGCTRTSSASAAVSVAAAAVEQGIPACSCIHTHF